MRNLRINEAETIFEPFYDGGESYPEHRKFSALKKYQIEYQEKTVAYVQQGWCSVDVILQSQKTKGYAVKMERDCCLDISEYDIFRLFGAVPENVCFRICGTVDGQQTVLMEKEGVGDTAEYDAPLCGSILSHISLEFGMKKEEFSQIALLWLGLSNKERQKIMESKQSPYDREWEGCFEENPEIKPIVGLFFDEEDLTELRIRLNKEPFLSITNELRKKAERALLLEPESYITDYVPRHDRRWGRDRDMKRPLFQENMEILAFIGLLDERTDMLHMACRKMLSLAVTPHWTESIMGHLPGATWHHRSFTEDDICSAIAMVLDFAGSLLTWHGKNMVYDALIMKGLPRFMADFYTMEYIRSMNQGIVFNHGRVLTLLVLCQRYPRYEKMLEEAAKDNREMIDRYVMEDGGTVEGPHYWGYTFSNVLETVALLARHEKKTLKEYAWDKLKLTGNYALTMLSDVKDGSYILPINDSHSNRYHPIISTVYKEISQDPRWKALYWRTIQEINIQDISLATLLLMTDDGEKSEGEIHGDSFQSLNCSGHTSLRRTTEDVGRVHCYLSGGPNFFAHCHADKGQLLLEVDGVSMLIDRGICAYSNPAVDILPRADKHNLFMPEAPAGTKAFDQNFHGAGAKVVRSTFENGCFEYCTDTTGAWSSEVVESMMRTVKSEDAHVYMIYDDGVFAQEYSASFRLHTYGTITEQENGWKITDGKYTIAVTPVNYTPVCAKFGEDGIDGELKTVNSLRLYVKKAKEHHIITRLEVGLAAEDK